MVDGPFEGVAFFSTNKAPRSPRRAWTLAMDGFRDKYPPSTQAEMRDVDWLALELLSLNAELHEGEVPAYVVKSIRAARAAIESWREKRDAAWAKNANAYYGKIRRRRRRRRMVK
jgi:hypothetical protein